MRIAGFFYKETPGYEAVHALFTSGQKQNGFPFRSGYRGANFCTKRSCGFAQSFVYQCVEEFFKVVSNE
jgi:hypothetical protein